jgi:uncharacterized membrane protein
MIPPTPPRVKAFRGERTPACPFGAVLSVDKVTAGPWGAAEYGGNMRLEGWHIVLIAVLAVALVVVFIAVVVIRVRRRAKGPGGRPGKERRLNELDYLRKRGVISLEEYTRSRNDILRS